MSNSYTSYIITNVQIELGRLIRKINVSNLRFQFSNTSCTLPVDCMRCIITFVPTKCCRRHHFLFPDFLYKSIIIMCVCVFSSTHVLVVVYGNTSIAGSLVIDLYSTFRSNPLATIIIVVKIIIIVLI